MNDFDGQPILDPLTGRELEILRLLAQGLSPREIAQELYLTPGTVKFYNQRIYGRLGVNSRTQAITRAQKMGLLDGKPNAPVTPASTPKHNLPAQTSPFIGRKREIAEIRRLLQSTRLLTLTGPGGTGKTRLALRVALEAVYDFADGVCFVDLAPLLDEVLVAKAAADVLGVMENAREPMLETLKRGLAERELLLFMDNFEHLIGAAPMVSELLMAAPRLKILVTSREVLHLSGEQEYPVPPLSLPSSEAVSIQHLADSEAVSLFMQRAQMNQPRFTMSADNAPAIAQICLRLDGLPLAIELAAARTKLLPPQALLTRLESPLSALTGGSRDLPARQQTLRSTLDWSYNLLDEGEKKLFARLAVFRGGRSLEAIEAVCGKELPIDVFDGLTSLLDKSLIQQCEVLGAEPRFVMLETIHEYAWERLEDSGEAEALRRWHADYFAELAERAEPELRMAQQSRWFQWLDAELDNFRAVLEWSLDNGEVALGARLTGALYLFWHACGYHVEGRHWTQEFVNRLDAIPRMHHAKLLICAGMLQDQESAKRYLMQALDISRELEDERHIAWALMFLGYVMVGNREAATPYAEAALALFRELDFQPGIAQSLNVLGEIARFDGDFDQAKRAYEECLSVSEQTGESRRRFMMYVNLAMLAQYEGDYARASHLSYQVVPIVPELSNRLDKAACLSFLAGLLASVGQAERAARLLGASDVILKRMGYFRPPVDKQEAERRFAEVRAQLDDATFEAAWAEGRAMSLEQAIAYALEQV